MPSLLRLLATEDDAIPLLLSLAAVNGDMRLYTEHLSNLCREGSGGVKRLACRYLEHLASVKEPLLALKRLADELGGSSLLHEVVRSLRLGLEPSEVAERIVDRIVAKLRARAELVEDMARAILEVLALTSTILAFAVMMSAFVAGSAALSTVLPAALAILAILMAFAAPSIAKLGAPRIPPWLAAFSATSLAAAAYALYARSLPAAIASAAATIPVVLYTLSWWREMRSISNIAIRLAEALQLGYMRPDDSLAYDVLMSAKHRVKSSLSLLLIDMLRLLPQEGSHTAARLLRNFAEFAARYLELAKSTLVKSLVYEAVVALSMPALSLLAFNTLNMMTAHAGAAPLPGLATLSTSNVYALTTLMNLPAVAYTLVTSKIGRGTPLLPLLHPLTALLTLLLLGFGLHP